MIRIESICIFYDIYDGIIGGNSTERQHQKVTEYATVADYCPKIKLSLIRIAQTYIVPGYI